LTAAKALGRAFACAWTSGESAAVIGVPEVIRAGIFPIKTWSVIRRSVRKLENEGARPSGAVGYASLSRQAPAQRREYCDNG
jgi:hypothetical protein